LKPPKIETIAMKTKSRLKPGQKITVCLRSTGGTKLTVTHAGMTAEVNGAELVRSAARQYVVAQYIGGMPVNVSRRVPAAIAVDSRGRSHAIHFWYDRWIGAYHRKLQFCREWEMADGSDLPPDIAAIADAALATA
jgi:hypothetical protein